MKFSRRQIGKGIATTLATSLIRTEASAKRPKDSREIPSTWNEVLPGVWRTTAGESEALTPVSTRYILPAAASFAKLPPVKSKRIPEIQGTVTSRGVKIRLPLAPGEQLYGFGLQFFTLQHRGKKRVIRVNADPRVDTGDSHAPVPFYVSSLGYGVLIDTARYATFYCGESRPKPTQAETPVSGGTVPLYTKSLQDDQASEVLVEIPNCAGVDVYFFGGPTLLDAVRRYNLFSGGGVAPPEWGLGFWYRAESNATDKQILKLGKEFRDREIPCDVFGLEAGWHTHAYSCTFAWHKERFPEPAAFVSELKGNGYRVNLWEHAFTHPSSPLFPSLEPYAGDKGVWGGLVPDFVDAKARGVFGGFHNDTLLSIGIDGFKLDECDNSDYTGGWSFAELSKFPSGADGELMHNLFGIRYQQTLWEPYRKRERPTYSLVRSSGALAAPYPFVLYSDLYDHRQFVRALVNSGFSGLLWCPEVRDAKSEEDLIRRLQTVVFSPLAMINGWYIPNPPWKQLDRKKNNAGDLTAGWERLEDRCREIIGWRMAIVPYLKSAFARYASDGTPPFRALAMDWPQVPEIAKIDDAWMVGDRMLVAPLFAGEPSRTITLPPGEWHDFWTGEHVHGGTVVKIASTQKPIPVFVMSGSLLPLSKVSATTTSAESTVLDVKVFGDGSLPFSWNCQQYGTLHLTWDSKSESGHVEQAGASRYTVARWTKAK